MNSPQTLLLALTVIAAASLAFGWLARRLGQPPVLGELAAGIALGPTLFGGRLPGLLFPGSIRPTLSGLADLGLAVFMCIIGMEVDRHLLRGIGQVVLRIAAGATVVPFGLGVAFAVVYARWNHIAHSVPFVLFMGVALSATAFPVLARIIDDRGLRATVIGTVALATAAVCDVAVWTALAVVQIVAGADAPGARWRILLVILYIPAMFLVARPVLLRLLPDRNLTPIEFGIAAVGLCASAGITEFLGLNLMFGAFLFGLIIPERSLVRADLLRGSRLAIGLLLPIYFIMAGLSINLTDLNISDLRDLALIMLIAIGGKSVGTLICARSVHIRWQHSTILSILMNTRGLTELVILAIGLRIGVLDSRLYSLMMVMAVTTTAMTGPLLRKLMPVTPAEAENSAADVDKSASAADK